LKKTRFNQILVFSLWLSLIFFHVAITPANHAITVTHIANGVANANFQSAAQGTVVTLTAAPNSGNRFVRWEVLSGSISLSSTTNPSATFTMPNNAVSVRAVIGKHLKNRSELVNSHAELLVARQVFTIS